jgi:lipopolysaccharide transport system ATP-binding protein
MGNIAIRAIGLGKFYRIGAKQEKYRTFRETVTDMLKAPFRRVGRLLGGESAADLNDSIWALKDVFFEIKCGEVVGVIGSNGAGKSTLLKILSRITEPTEGRADVFGRVGSLLEVGTGFHPELTGRENIFLSAAILGMKKFEIDRRFDEIVAFSEVDKFIDTPVKHYSTGMFLRLAFGVAAHLEPEILLVDEVLAVGDTAFQRKCLGKMEDVAKAGRTVLFVSHNMAAVQGLCQRAIVLTRGRVACDTSVADAVRTYPIDRDSVLAQSLHDRTDRKGDGAFRFTELWLENRYGLRLSKAMVGEDIRFCLAYRADSPLRNVQIVLTLEEQIGAPVVDCYTSDVGQVLKVVPMNGVVVCEIKKFPIRGPRYSVDLYASVQGCTSDWVRRAAVVDVEDGDFYGTGKLDNDGKFLVSHDWNIRSTTQQ